MTAARVGNTAWVCYFLRRTLLEEQFILRVEKKHAERRRIKCKQHSTDTIKATGCLL